MKNLLFPFILLSLSASAQKGLLKDNLHNKTDQQIKVLLLGKWEDKEYNLLLKPKDSCEIDWRDGVVMNTTWHIKNRVLIVDSYTRKEFRYFNTKVYQYKIIGISNKQLRLHPITSKNPKEIIVFKKLDS